MTNYICIDVGGTTTRIATAESSERAEITIVERFPTQAKYELQLEALHSILVQIGQPAGIGLSLGGQMARDGRSVAVAPNLPDYVGQPLVETLEQRWHCPVRLGHDTVCGLLAEKNFGALQTSERCAYLTLSTGTGAAIFLGSPGLAISIEIGHQVLDSNPLICLCGQIGCLETCTGGRQLEQRLGYELTRIVDHGFWEQYCEKLAIGLVNLAHLTRVELVAVSGSIALKNEFLLPLLQRKIDERLLNARLTLTSALLGENAPLIGALALLQTPPERILH
ncbi:glucokinase [Tengunoibacter tsumagoiensis]|uniref:Glucokinase n=2 Tax=Tengunoibacter tsumagoiensis TaxID=2014871 RepID=A0A401ZXX5_9CHLR|nr:glucokinase [Tengunoibacter tsumagoiensis]